ncbi:MAG: sugar phosphate isomerase/epimerase [Ruminococcaceae bacterium]|nr:sugar phosphate isomerase/epimerase [Oscillospiraceae bacterium]
MKIGVEINPFVNGYHRWGKERYKKLRAHGYEAMDYGMCDTNSIIYTLPEAESDAFLKEEKRLAEEAGIEISQVHGPWRWPAQDSTPEDRAERMEKMKKSIRACSVLGCKNWVVHPIMPCGVDEADQPELAQKTWDLNLEFMSELVKTAKEYDITICLENMPMLNYSLAKPTDVLRLVKALNDEHFKICLDTGHVNVFQEKLPIGDEVRAIGEELRVIHVHDNKVGWDLHLPPYYGTLNWKEFADALKDIGYHGVFSLEFMPPVRLPDGIFEKMSSLMADIAREVIK